MEHEVKHKQASGWWANLVQASCTCGWLGPVHDANKYHWTQALYATLDRDAKVHLDEVNGENL